MQDSWLLGLVLGGVLSGTIGWVSAAPGQYLPWLLADRSVPSSNTYSGYLRQ